MALIKCPGCNTEISDTEKVCPNCGTWIKSTNLEEDLNKYNISGSYKGGFLLGLSLGILGLIIAEAIHKKATSN